MLPKKPHDRLFLSESRSAARRDRTPAQYGVPFPVTAGLPTGTAGTAAALGLLESGSSIFSFGLGISFGGVSVPGRIGVPGVAHGVGPHGSTAQHSDDFLGWHRALILSSRPARWPPEAQGSQQGAAGAQHAAAGVGGAGAATGAQHGAAGAQHAPPDFGACRARMRSSRLAFAHPPESQHGAGAGVPTQPPLWLAGTTAPGPGTSPPPRVDDMSNNVAYTVSILQGVGRGAGNDGTERSLKWHRRVGE
jgi:hypothetical protein